MENNAQGTPQGDNLIAIPTLSEITTGINSSGEQIRSLNDLDINKDKLKEQQQQPSEQQPQQQQQEKPSTIDFILSDIQSTSDEDNKLKSDIFSFFKGEKIDDKGNLINKEGKIVLDKNTLLNYIDKDELPLDEKGNQVNLNGDILKTAEDIQKEQSVVLNTKLKFEKELGIEFKDKDGKVVEYPDTEDGIFQLVNDTVQKLTVNSVVDFLNNNPDIKDYYQYLKLGGKKEDYTSLVDYSSIDIKQLDVNSKLNLIKTLFEKQNLPNTTSLLELIKTAGDEEINKQTASALLTLNELNNKSIEEKNNLIKQQQLKEQQEAQMYWSKVQETIRIGKLSNISIPENKKQEFYTYLATPITRDGKTQSMIDEEKSPLEFDLMINYLHFVKGDLSKLVEIKAKEDNIYKLRERIAKNNKLNITGEQPTNVNEINTSAITLSNLLSNNK